ERGLCGSLLDLEGDAGARDLDGLARRPTEPGQGALERSTIHRAGGADAILQRAGPAAILDRRRRANAREAYGRHGGSAVKITVSPSRNCVGGSALASKLRNSV